MTTSRLGRSILLAFALAGTPGLAQAQTCGGELCPGRIWNPAAHAWDQQALYVPSRDEYFIVATEWTFVSGGLVGRFLDTNGVLSGGVTTLYANGAGGFTGSGMAYNSDRDEILLISREADPPTLRGMYLGSDGQPVSSSFVIGVGDAPHVAYSPDSGRFLLTWSRRVSGIFYTFYALIDGQSTNPAPILSSGTIDSNALSDGVAYSTVSQKFLVVYVKDFAPPRRADIYGRFVSANGVPGAVFPIDTTVDNQQMPRVAYASSTNRFMIVSENWSSGNANARALLLDANGALLQVFNLAATSAWDTPGPVGYNSATETFIATWRTAFSDSNFDHRAREYSPVDGAPKGPSIVVSPLNIGLASIDTRPDAADPQALILWRNVNGDDGVHAGIMHLPPAPPQVQPPMPAGFLGVAYSQKIPVAGGRPPLSYLFISGQANLPAGLAPASDFSTSGLIEGTPTALGTSGTFRVRVTDADNRADEEDLTLSIVLAPPTPIGPTGAVNDATPTYSWGATPGASSYNLVVENVTDGGAVVLDQSGIAHTFPITSFTPAAALASGKVYRFKVRATNGAQFSAFSDYMQFEVDTTAPGVTNLLVSLPVGYLQVAATAIASSGDANATVGKDKATDGNGSTFWSTPGRATLQTEFLTVDLGVTKNIGRVRVAPRTDTVTTFPKDFQVQISTDGTSFTTVLSLSNFVATAGMLHEFPFTPINARYVRILVTRVTPHTDTFFYTQIAEVRVDGVTSLGNALRLSWTAPGDDGSTGEASDYDVRWSFSPITAGNFGSASVVPEAIDPGPAGTAEQFTFSGLIQETTYYFAMKAKDNAENFSPMSNVAVGVTLGVAPSAIANLSATNPQFTTMGLTWSAPGDDGGAGTAFAYVVRYSTSPLTSANFDSATQVMTGVPSPAIAGTAQNTTVTGLTHTTTYYFGIKTFDEVGNTSLSNVVTASTLDATAPAAVTNLSGTSGVLVPVPTAAAAVSSSGDGAPTVSKEKTVDSDPATFWSTPPRGLMQQESITWDVGTVKTLTRLRLLSRDIFGGLFPQDYLVRVSTNGSSYVTVGTATGVVAGNGQWFVHDFAPMPGRFVQLVVTKARQHTDGMFYVQIAEAEVSEGQYAMGSVTLQWTATGDDGTTGTAASYDLRRSLSPITAGNFSSATVIPTPAPLPAGSIEIRAVSGLTPETRYYVALKVNDEVPNTSALSNAISVDTPGTAPDAVTNLAASPVPGSGMNLTWNSTGDDGLSGQATAYEIRYSTSPITDANFSAATLVSSGVPAPAPSGTPQNMTVGGLSNQTLYHFAMKVKDELNNTSGLSNVASGTTLDEIAPAAVSNLSAVAGAFSFFAVPASAVSSSGDANATVGKDKVVDGNVTTFWSTPPRGAVQAEFLTLDVGSVRSVGRVRLTSRDVGNLFPEDFEIQVSVEGTSWLTVLTRTAFVVSPGATSTLSFTATPGRYVRIWVTKPRQHTDGMFYVQMAEMGVDEVMSQADQVTLQWTSPGDDGNVGTASVYDVRYSTVAMTSGNFGTATMVLGEGAPQVAGTLKTLVVSGLPAETLFYFGMKTEDERPNTSGLSNVVSVTTVPVPPAAVTDLMVVGTTPTSVSLSFRATGDDGMVGVATSYEVRYSTVGMTSGNFGSGTLVVSGVPVPGAPGTLQNMTATGLLPGTYFLGMKVHDEAGGVSLLSNVVVSDIGAPSAVSDLTVSSEGVVTKVTAVATSSSGDGAASVSKEKVVDGNETTFWSTPPRALMQAEYVVLDSGSVLKVKKVRVRSRNDYGGLFPEDLEIQTSVDGVSYQTVATETGIVMGAGVWREYELGLPAISRWVRVRAAKTRRHTDLMYYAQVGEVEVYKVESQAGALLLKWTAPGDDGAVGTASVYDVRYSLNPITGANFGSAVTASGEPVPRVSGSMESLLLTGLSAETRYYVAMKSVDDSGNTSPMSNVVTAFSPGTSPAGVTDLSASNATTSAMDLEWTATGDDGSTGTATSYEVRYSTAMLTESNFGVGTLVVSGVPVPSGPGTSESMTVSGLPGETRLYFGLKVKDEAGNASVLSNVATGDTLAVPPSAVSDLGAALGSVSEEKAPGVAVSSSGDGAASVSKEKAVDGSLATFWSTPPRTVAQVETLTVDVGMLRAVGRVRMRSRDVTGSLFPEDVEIQVSSDNVAFTTVTTVLGLPTAGAMWHEIPMVAPAVGRYVRIRATKTRQHTDGMYYVQVAEVEVMEKLTEVNLTWTAPGDDGTVGQAASYDIRYSTSPITSGNFGSATAVSSPPVPGPSGSSEGLTVTLRGGATYSFALKAIDDGGNLSLLSNVPSVSVP